jgi:hypothetical protein
MQPILSAAMVDSMRVVKVCQRLASLVVITHHYLHRKPPISYAFGLYVKESLKGVCTFGVPPSRHAQISACRSDPAAVLELNRLWVSDEMPRNTESWFVSRCLSALPGHIVISYADTAHGHQGYVYRALSWHFAGLTDEDRKTPRFDYITHGKHSRSAFRTGSGLHSERVRRLPKYRYWTVTGDRRQRRKLLLAATWPSRSWVKSRVEASHESHP